MGHAIAFATSSPHDAWAGPDEVEGQPVDPRFGKVTLKNGRVIEGTIVEYREGVRVMILLEAGRVANVVWGDIAKVRSGSHRFDATDPAVEAKTTEATDGSEPSDSGERGASRRVERRRGGLTVEVDLEEAEKRRRAWLERGGWLGMFSLQASALGILMPERTFDYPYVCPDLRTGKISQGKVPFTSQDGGGGGGVSTRMGTMYLKLPSEGGSVWWAFRAGTGFDGYFNYFATSTPDIRCRSGGGASTSPTVTGSSSTVLQVPVNAGVHLGLGSSALGRWSGVVLGLAWAPAFSYFKASEGEGSGSVSLSGTEVTFDVTTLEGAVEKYASKAHFRFSFFFLPPVKEDYPTLLSIGLGAVWY